jgi:hypothetical protein
MGFESFNRSQESRLEDSQLEGRILWPFGSLKGNEECLERDVQSLYGTIHYIHGTMRSTTLVPFNMLRFGNMFQKNRYLI